MKFLLIILGIVATVAGEDWEQRLETASKEAWTYGPAQYEHWAVQPGKEEFQPSFDFTVVFSEADAAGTNVSCFRIPSSTT